LKKEELFEVLNKAFIQHSLFFVILGSVLLVIALIIATLEYLDIKQTPIGNNILFLGLATISIGLAGFSLKLSEESDKKMEILSKDTFLDIAGELEDRRLALKNMRLQLEHMQELDNYINIVEYQTAKINYHNQLSYSIWKCFTDVKRVELFKDYLRSQEYLEDMQEKMLNYVHEYYKELILGRDFLNMVILLEYKDHIKWMFWIVGEFEVYPIYENNNILYENMLNLQDEEE